MFSTQPSSSTECEILTPDAVPLSVGRSSIADAGRLIVRELDRPGRLIRHVMLDGIREIAVRLGEGEPVRAEVERLDYHPGSGRICVVKMASVAFDSEGVA